MKLIINNTQSQLVDCYDKEILDDIDNALSYQQAGCEFIPAFVDGFWDGKKHLFNRKYGKFQTGLLERVYPILYAHKAVIETEDNRSQLQTSIPIKTNTVLRQDQEEVIDLCMKHPRSVIKAGTGFGKSYCQVELICRLNRPTVILVNKLDIMEQFKQWFRERANIEVGQIGNGIINPQRITIAMIQTLAMAFKIAKFKDEVVDKTKYQLIFDTCKNAEVFIGDEIHSMVDGDIWNKVHAYFTNAIYRLGFSATPYQRLSTELLLEAAFGPIRIDISCSELIKKGFLTRPDVYVVKFKQPRLPGGTTYQEAYRDRISENEDRNLLITKIASKCWKNNLRVFVAITHLKQGKFLKQMLEKVIGEGSVVFIEGIMDVEKRQQAIKDMEDGKLRMVIGSRCMNEGVNIKSMQVLISARAGISKIEYIQTIGRALRLHPDKAKATIFDIQDYGCKYFGAHSMERMEVLLTEPEFNIKVIESDKV